MAADDDNVTLAPGWDDPSPRRTLRPAAHHGSRDPLGILPSLPRLDEAALRIGHTLGEGGMGVVRVAVQTALGREVAVKLLRPEHDTPLARRKVLHEAWVTGALEHPNVVPVYEVGQDDAGRPYLVLKRIAGEAWSELIAAPDRVRARDPLDWHLRVLLQVCNAVAFAHSRGVLHRDLKPDNVMIGAYGEVYVLDWGIAVALDGSPLDRLARASDQTAAAGTPAYLAPEQLREDGEPLSERTDVYLLGGALYHVLHGRPPHQADGPTEGASAILERVRRTDPAVADTVPDGLRAILVRALARRPADRHPSVDAFRADVQRWLDRRGAERLLASADADRDRLLAEVSSDAGHARVLAALGACRFGYQRVIESDPELAPAARAGLDAALVAAAGWHLGRSEWGAAELVAGEASAVPPDLAAAITRGRDRDAADRQRLHRAEDQRAGARTRVVALLLVAVGWIAAPLATYAWDPSYEPLYQHIYASGAALVGWGVAVAVWANESLSKSDLNRRVQAMLVIAPAMTPFTAAGCQLLGLPSSQVHVVMLAVHAAMAVVYTTMVDRRMWPAVLGYASAWLVCASAPTLTLLGVGLANLVFAITAVRTGWEEFVTTLRGDA